MPEPIAANGLYEMQNLRPKLEGAMKAMAKRKPALMAKTQKNFLKARRTEKGSKPLLVFCFLGSNNQDKGPTRRMMVRMNLMFPRRSP